MLFRLRARRWSENRSRRAVFGIAKSGVIGIEFYKSVAILHFVVAICHDHAHVDVVE